MMPPDVTSRGTRAGVGCTVRSHMLRGDQDQGSPWTVRPHVQKGRPGPGGSMYSEFQCIMGNAHMGTSLPPHQKNDGQPLRWWEVTIQIGGVYRD